MLIKTLKNKIILLVVAVMFFLGILTVLSVSSVTQKFLLDQKKEELSFELVNTADRVASLLDVRKNFVEKIARSKTAVDAMKNPAELKDDDEFGDFLRNLKAEDGCEDILMYDPKGSVIAATDEKYLGHNFEYRNYFNDAMRNGFATEVVINVFTKKPIFVFAHKVLDPEGKTLGMVLTLDSINFIDSALSVNNKDGRSSDGLQGGMLVDDNGVILSLDVEEHVFRSLGQLSYGILQGINADKRYGDEKIIALQHEDLLEAVIEDRGLYVNDYYDSQNKEWKLAGIVPVRTYPFHVATELKGTNFNLQIAKIYSNMGVIIFAACLSLLALIYFFLRRFLKPLKQLKHAAEKISRDDFDYNVSIKSGDELEELGAAFNAMKQSLLISKSQIEAKVEDQTAELLKKQTELENQQKAVVNILEDISEEKEISEKLATDLEKFKLAIEHTNDQVVITDKDGVIIYGNPAMTTITGYTLEEAVGKTPSLWGRQMSNQYYRALWKTVKEEKKPYDGEIYNKCKDGTKFLAHIHISPILDRKGELRFFVGVVRDISKEREAQLQLKKDAEELKKVNVLVETQKERAESILGFLKSIGDGVVATDLSGKIIFFNEAAEKLTGISIKNAMGKNAGEVLFVVKEKHKHTQYDVISNALDDKYDFNKSNDHFLVKRKDDSLMPVSFSASLIYDAHKEKQGCIVVMRDVTQQREIEKTKDDFLSVAAHQLRTPLTGIRWSLEMLVDGDLGELPEEAKKVLEGIFENNQRLIMLVNDLLDVSRINMGKAKEEPVLLDVCKTMQEAISTLSALAQERGNKISFEAKSANIPMVQMGPKHLFQSFENLLANAIKYTPKGGDIKAQVDFKKGNVIASISDNGIGIPKVDQEKIFSKFFRASNATLKETEGSGLGLNVVRSFIEEFGGTVSFKSEENKGTTFTIKLPVDPK